jgi:phospholipid transport system substrate-binding protein
VRTYAGALAQVSDQTISIKPCARPPTTPMWWCAPRCAARAIRSSSTTAWKTPGEGAGWKIYNLNVLGVWLVETYRSQFAQEINAKGIDGLIATLAERNKANGAKKG